MKIKKFLKFFWLSVWLLPASALAQTSCTSNCVSSGLGISGLSTMFGSSFGSVQNIPELIVFIINLLLWVAGGIAVLFVIIGGFWYITSAGNEEQAEKGKTALINAIIGIVIVVLSYVIINVIVNTVSGINGIGF